MRSECGQGAVEWIAVMLLVAIALAALGRLAPRGHDRGLATVLMHSMACAARDGCKPPRVVGTGSGKRTESQPPGHEAFTAPPLVPHPDPAKRDRAWPAGKEARPGGTRRPSTRELLRWVRRAGGRALVDRLRRGAGLVWRRAWFGCLAYERARFAFLHPESRLPGYTMPPSVVLRIANDCISPVDLVRDWPLYRGR
jgi:hypothetical protein